MKGYHLIPLSLPQAISLPPFLSLHHHHGCPGYWVYVPALPDDTAIDDTDYDPIVPEDA